MQNSKSILFYNHWLSNMITFGLLVNCLFDLIKLARPFYINKEESKSQFGGVCWTKSEPILSKIQRILLIESRPAFPPAWRRTKQKIFLKIIGSNRRLAAGRLEIDFKNPWNYLAEMPAEARGPAQQQAVCGINSAPSEANSAVNKLWWCLLDDVRTFFEQNPDADWSKIVS